MAIAGGNITLDSTEGMDKISQTEKVTSPYFSDGSTTLANFSSDITLGEVGSSKRNVFIDENVGIKLRNNTTDIASFGDDITLNGGTIQLNGASTNDRVVIDNDGLEIYTANVKKAEAKDTGDFPMYGEAMLRQSAQWKLDDFLADIKKMLG